MACGLMLAASLMLADPAVTAVSQPMMAEAGALPPSVAAEPLFADLVERSGRLKGVVEGWMASGAADAAGFFGGPDYSRFKAEALDLAARDMKGHEDLKARNLDGDLKCILRGISEDIPRRLDAVEGAGNAANRKLALEELAYLLNDNVEVITAPLRPATVVE